MATNRNYTEDLRHNIIVSEEAENIAKELLEKYTHQDFVSVRSEEEFFHIGDLLTMDGKGYDVKDDGIIHKTHNVFCETKKHWKSTGETTNGWMLNSEYDYLCILDQTDKHLYVLDFKMLKKVYLNYGRAVYNINMGDNYTDGYIIGLSSCRRLGVLVHDIKYTYDEEWECYDIAS